MSVFRFRPGHAAWLCLVSWLPNMPASGHPISVTQTYAFVAQDKVSVNLDVFVEDLFLFHNLKPNDQDFLEPDVIEQGIQKHRAFLLERFRIRDAEGQLLAGKSTKVKRFEMPPEGIPLAELMAHQLSFTMEYPLAEAPEFLTFSQHLMDENLLVPAEMQLQVKQEGGETPFQQILYPNTPQTIRFSWQNPPLAADASEDAWLQWYEKQKQETLGITSYSSIYSFLYIEDYEVRHEILIPLLTLEESVLITRADENFLEVPEQNAAREQIAAFFAAGNPVEIDGQLVEPVIERLDFYGLDFKDFARRGEPRRVSMANARAGIILSYKAEGSPGMVKVTWDRFNRFIWTVNMIIYAYEDTQTATLSRIGRQNTFEWNNPGRSATMPMEQVPVDLPPHPTWSLPIIPLVCATLVPLVLVFSRRRPKRSPWVAPLLLLLLGGAVAGWPFIRWKVTSPLAASPPLSEEHAGEIFSQLHRNTYRAFVYRDEEDAYDALALSVAGTLLRDLYLELRRGLVMQEQGGAVSRIRDVNIAEGHKLSAERMPQSADPGGFAYQCRWTVAGTVEHWGHVHARTNEYQARFTVEPRDGFWRITGLDVEDERRVKFETTVRGL